MPPNKKGGKNYKKGKHADDAPVIYERLEDQMYGRVIKVLGNCNLLVYCNDNRERLCHIRGNMRKKVWINTGDIVLISIRDFGKEEAGKMGRGDVCAKYDQNVVLKLRQKDPSINPNLFTNIGAVESDAKAMLNADGGFDFDEESEPSNSDEDDEIKKRINKGETYYSNRVAQRIAVNNNDSDADNDGDINIDDI